MENIGSWLNNNKKYNFQIIDALIVKFQIQVLVYHQTLNMKKKSLSWKFILLFYVYSTRLC